MIGTETGRSEVVALQRQLATAHARIEALETLQAVTLWVNSELQLDTLLAEVLSAAMAVTGADAGALLLLDDSRGQLEYVVVPGELGADLVLATDDGISTTASGLWSLDLGVPMLIINHATAELPGMRALAGYVEREFPGVPVHYLPCEFPYQVIT